ncbi:hypothetical protein BS78_10G069400 [Paspalum vaginatum]|nr:hypothetical protein BS78_10G069400 [Paspalum vaginatum]
MTNHFLSPRYFSFPLVYAAVPWVAAGFTCLPERTVVHILELAAAAPSRRLHSSLGRRAAPARSHAVDCLPRFAILPLAVGRTPADSALALCRGIQGSVPCQRAAPATVVDLLL